jgi:DNA-binding response OmpR family regulator
LPASHTILVLAPDNELRRSVRFALEAEGFRVDTISRLPADNEAELSPQASCVIVDDRSLPDTDSGRLQQLGLPIIFLTEGLVAPKFAWKRMLLKPLLGRELIDAVFASIPQTATT